MSVTLPLGAPGIYEISEPPVRALTGVRMDVCAFVGVAARGPARVRTQLPDGQIRRRRSIATAVESWDDFVRCDRTTMTQNDLDNGRMICLIGVAPVKPAEFVIFRIGQWTADASLS